MCACKGELPPNSRFCPHCGAAVEDEAPKSGTRMLNKSRSTSLLSRAYDDDSGTSRGPDTTILKIEDL